MNKITFRHLEIFHAVYEYGNMSRAAERLGITQPAVTRQMQQLELKVGAPVLEIVGRRAHLTPKGKELLAIGNDILHQVDDIPNQLNKDAKGGMKGQLRIGTTPLYKGPILAIMEIFAKHYPQVKIKPVVMDPSELADKLVMHEVDVALTARNFAHIDGVVSRNVDEFESVFTCSTDSKLAGREVTVKEMTKSRIIVPSQNNSVSNYLLGLVGTVDEAIDILELDNVYTSMMGVRAGLGVSLCPDFLVNVKELGYQLAQFKLKGARKLSTLVFLSSRSQDQQFAPLQTLIELLEKKRLTTYS